MIISEGIYVFPVRKNSFAQHNHFQLTDGFGLSVQLYEAGPNIITTRMWKVSEIYNICWHDSTMNSAKTNYVFVRLPLSDNDGIVDASFVEY